MRDGERLLDSFFNSSMFCSAIRSPSVSVICFSIGNEFWLFVYASLSFPSAEWATPIFPFDIAWPPLLPNFDAIF